MPACSGSGGEGVRSSSLPALRQMLAAGKCTTLTHCEVVVKMAAVGGKEEKEEKRTYRDDGVCGGGRRVREAPRLGAAESHQQWTRK